MAAIENAKTSAAVSRGARGKDLPAAFELVPFSVREASWLESLKRRVYLAAVSLVALAALLGFALDGLRGYPLWIRLLYGPISAAVSMAVAIAFYQRRLALKRVEAIGFACAAILLLSHVAIVLFASPGNPARLQFAAFAPWIAAVFILAFLMLATRVAVRAALALYAVMLLLALVSALMRGTAGVGRFELNALFQQFAFANGFYIFLLYVMARAKEEYGKAEYKSLMMDRMAHHDELTGSPNRRYIVGACSKEIERLARRERPFTVVIVDIDHFKLVNDTYGHAVGDAVLCKVAELLQGELRRGDDFGRIGGEEFIVLAYEADSQTGLALAERLRAVLERSDWQAFRLPPVTASFGVANYRGGDDFESLLARADRALYRAKHGGRNRAVLEA